MAASQNLIKLLVVGLQVLQTSAHRASDSRECALDVNTAGRSTSSMLSSAETKARERMMQRSSVGVVRGRVASNCVRPTPMT